jgi:hypothetical protein
VKRIVLFGVALMCSLLFVANAENVVKPLSSSQQKCAGTSSSCEKKIKNLSKRAEYYHKKAGRETNKDLAAIYTKCAEAKQKMADGYTKAYKNSQKCKIICSSNPDIKSGLSDGKKMDCMLGRKKRMRMSTCTKKIKKCANMCLEKAKQAELDGKKELAQQYNEIAVALQAKSEGLKLVSEGKKEFKNARKELKGLKNKTAAKAVNSE